MMPKLPKGFTHPMKIGGGAFGNVYRARQEALDRWVAIKIVSEKDHEKRRDILKEAKTQAKLRVDCIPQVFDAFEWQNQVCIVMHWIKGVSLKHILEQPLTHEERLWLADGFIGAISRLHREGYAHRDIKPTNILLSPSDGFYLIDFSFTKHVLDGEKSIEGFAKGTPAYMAPEIWRGSPDIDYMRADMFSAGIILRDILLDSPESCIINDLLQNDPALRITSGMELMERWLAVCMNTHIVPNWPQIASQATSEQLSNSLFNAARQLLLAGRDDEAYWLLVESLEENPDFPEALRLMESFPKFVSQKKFIKKLRYSAYAVSALILIFSAYYIGWQSGKQGKIAINPSVNAKKIQAIIGSIPSQMVHGVKLLDLMEDSSATKHLSGNIRIYRLPEKGTLMINEKEYNIFNDPQAGINLPFGEYRFAWLNADGSMLWRERVSILPFQSKQINISGIGRTKQKLL